MYEGYSENNLLINREEEQYNFHDSVVINPINLNATHFMTENHKTKNMNALTKTGLGTYQEFKLNNMLAKQLTEQNNISNLLNVNKGDDNRGPSVIQVVSIDEQSNIIEIGPKFIQLMKKYSSNDVAFVSLVGEKMSGKSFFYDKILNLAEIRGNNFCQRHNPAIYTYPIPFVKDGLYIFLLELGGCSLKSEQFKLLNSICLILSSVYTVMTSVQKTESEQAWNLFQAALSSCMKTLNCEDIKHQQNEYLNIRNMFYISRNNQNNSASENLIKEVRSLFQQIQTVTLPNALIKGNKEDLTTYSFLAKQYINPNYIKDTSYIFKQIYQKTHQKKIKNLIINGNITNKMLLYIASSLNSKGNIFVENMYDEVLKQLYISAYNFCVMLYHEQLQRYFDDQQPKNSDQMYQMFQKAAENAIYKFDEFNLQPSYHTIYEEKLIEHIRQKEQLLCSINREKTKQYLQEEMNINKMKSTADLGPYLRLVKQGRRQLDDGRGEALKQTLTHLFSIVSGGSTFDNSLQRQLEEKQQRLQQQVQLKRQQLLKKENLNKKKIQEEKKEQQNLKKEENEVQKQFQKVKSFLKSQINDQAIEKMKKQIEDLKSESKKADLRLTQLKEKDIQKQIADACSGNQAKIKQAILRQKELQKQIESLQAANKQTQGKQKVQPSKIKSSEVKAAKKEGKK